MEYKVYKSLDKSSSLFGLVGTYFYWAAAGVAIAVVVGIIVGNITNGIIGSVAFLALAAAAYFGVLAIQSRMSERERAKWMCRRNLPDFVIVPPKRFSTFRKAYYRDETKPSNKQFK